MEQQTFELKIYTLSGSDKVVFYVGCTIVEIEERLRQHITEAKYYEGFTKMPQRSRVIRENNFEIFATIVDVISISAMDSKEAKHKAEHFETEWIRKFQDKGVVLANKRNVLRKGKRPQFVGKTVKAA